jgi:hypothetical protein
VYDACTERGIVPIIPVKETHAVKRGEHRAPECEHGTWTFAGADFKRNAAKWRCPTRRVRAEVPLAEGFPPAPADPA